jgi:ABC-type spermidine/putrescine transport system permease subunit II
VRRVTALLLPAFSIAVLIFLYLPIVLVIVNAFNSDQLLARWGGFTTSWFGDVLSDSRVRDDFVTSIWVGIVAALISLLVAIPAALWARRATTRGRRALDATTYMRIVLPEVVAALSLFMLFRRLELPLGIGAVIIGHVVFNSAYATVILQARLATMNRVLEDAAADLGAPPRRVFVRVTFPLLLPAVIVAALFAFTFSFDNVITSAFLGGSGVETLPMLIFGLARNRVTPELNAIGAILMLITTLSLLLSIIVVTARSGGGSFLGLRLRRGPR